MQVWERTLAGLILLRLTDVALSWGLRSGRGGRVAATLRIRARSS